MVSAHSASDALERIEPALGLWITCNNRPVTINRSEGCPRRQLCLSGELIEPAEIKCSELLGTGVKTTLFCTQYKQFALLP
jgi:hypothetical protein